jgi:hypothetical protein
METVDAPSGREPVVSARGVARVLREYTIATWCCTGCRPLDARDAQRARPGVRDEELHDCALLL